MEPKKIAELVAEYAACITRGDLTRMAEIWGIAETSDALTDALGAMLDQAYWDEFAARIARTLSPR